ncbi:unnamed protein product [Paramecium primaurelia]|uniref:Uncharacterized protein n=1 Tax=Paramecium primaurelia TaxID=5886 RepID=A0A8S1Q1W2_PARPR|nr:unnamed protein product [Paramecium primaurelia]
MKKIQNNQPINRPVYQQAYKVQDQVVPQGIAFFSTSGKRHYPDFQRGELETYQGMQHLLDPPKKLTQDYDRSLNTKDIDGAVTNTLRSKVVKNMELAQVYKQEKQKSLWEHSSKPSDLDSQVYQPRKQWDDNDPYKNRSAIYTNYEDSKRKLDDLSDKHFETIKYPESTTFKPNQQFHESQLQQQQLYTYDDPNLIAQRQQQQNQQDLVHLQNSLSQPHLVAQTQNTQPSNQSEQRYQQPPLYQQQIEDERQKQQQLLMQKQWEQQRIESLQKLQQQQNDKIREQHNLKMQQDQDYQIIQEQRQSSLNQKQQYARDLRQQQESNKEGNYRKGFTPPPASKSEIIGSLLQAPKLQKSQGFDGDMNQDVRDSLSKEIEENEKKLVINRFRPHELQQYIYDMKNGRIGGSKTRNNPTFMSYAGQQLVNQQQ